jgi:hypothetical protein
VSGSFRNPWKVSPFPWTTTFQASEVEPHG